jgi:Protein of unknown function (DUF1569)
MKTFAHPGDRAELLERLGRLSPESARRWGRMSAHQMVCHLNDSMLVMAGRKSASPATGPLQRTVVKWIALYAPLAWPPGILTRPEVDQEIGGTPPVDFCSDVAQLVDAVSGTEAGRIDLRRRSHPIFGPMSEAQWLRWAYLHMDHHLRQFGV